LGPWEFLTNMLSPLRRRSRLLLVPLAGVFSIVAGTILVFRLIRVDTMNALPTPVLLAVLGLLALPVVCAWAFWLQRSMAARAEAARTLAQAEDDLVETPAQEPARHSSGIPGRQASRVSGRRTHRTKARIHEPTPDLRHG
jgi:hypothetical protein